MKIKNAIIWHNVLDSTNSEAVRQLADLDNLSVIATKKQTEGKGQGEHIWLSEEGMNLTFSIILKYADYPLYKRIQACDQAIISHITALSIIKFLEEKGIKAKIKLPNDIYVNNNKICGILIRHSIKGNELANTVIGIGININQTIFDPSLPNPTSLALETGKTYEIEKQLEEYLAAFNKYLMYLNPMDYSKIISLQQSLQMGLQP
jgi:BirA family biotin operon repressor/biotin-[acetyl-CoA-carboxylase] ligase